jgi:hypothetical protein
VCPDAPELTQYPELPRRWQGRGIAALPGAFLAGYRGLTREGRPAAPEAFAWRGADQVEAVTKRGRIPGEFIVAVTGLPCR